MQPYGAVLAIVGGATLLQLANTIFAVLLPLHLAQGGASGTAAGGVAAAYGAGFLVGCLRANRLIREVGHIRAFAVLAATCAVLSLLFAATGSLLAWVPLRFVMGLCLAGLFATTEGWLSAATPKSARGGVLSFYLIGTKLAAVGGQALLAQGGLATAAWFAGASAVFSLSLIPVALTRTSAPPPPRIVLLDPRALYRVAPAAIVGCLAAGLLNSAAVNLTPVYGVRQGLPVGLTVVLLSLMQLGSLLFQWPLGRLSDRIDRRLVIVACGVGVAVVSLLVLAGASGSGWRLMLLFGLWGGFSMSFYGVCMAHASDFAEPDQMVAVASGALLVWAVGSMLGPLLAAPLVDVLGPQGLFIYLGAVGAGLAGFVGWRMSRRAAPPAAMRSGFVNLPATSPRLVEIDPRTAGRAPEDVAAGR